MRCDPFTLKVGIFKGFKGKLSLCCLTTIWYHNVLNVISIVTSYRVVNDELFLGVVIKKTLYPSDFTVARDRVPSKFTKTYNTQETDICIGCTTTTLHCATIFTLIKPSQL